MEYFINNIKLIKKDIDSLKETYLINHQLKNKQILIYYLYRLLCRNYKCFELFVSQQEIIEIKTILNLPIPLNKCVPMCKNIPNDIKVLDILFTKILNCFIKVKESIKQNKDLKNKEEIVFLNDFCLEKNEKDLIKMDLVLLSGLLPKLGKINSKPFKNI